MDELLNSHNQESVNDNDDGGDATIKVIAQSKGNECNNKKTLESVKYHKYSNMNTSMDNYPLTTKHLSEEKAAEIVREHREAVRIKKAKEGWPTAAKPPGHQKEVVKQGTVTDNEGGLILEQIVEPLEQQEALRLEEVPTQEDGVKMMEEDT